MLGQRDYLQKYHYNSNCDRHLWCSYVRRICTTHIGNNTSALRCVTMEDNEDADPVDAYNIRLLVIQGQVRKHYQVCRNILLEYHSGKASSRELSAAVSALKTKNERYVTETHLYLQNNRSGNAAFIVEHTNLQLECDNLIAEIANDIRSSYKTNIDSATCKLPELKLVKFHGEVSRWYEFWDRFSSSVHRKNLKGVDKLAYLNGCLEGIAKEAIEGLETTDANYEVALKILQERFGRRAIVIDNHYIELYKLKAKNLTIRESRRLLNEIERHLRVLSALGENTDGAHLRSVIMEKFPRDIIIELKMRMSSDEESTSMVRKHLEHIITAKECSNSVATEFSQPEFSTEAMFTHGRQIQQFKKFNKQYTNNKFIDRQNNKYSNRNQVNKIMKRKCDSDKENYGKRFRNSCIFCGGAHFNDECNIVVSIADRKKKLIDRCYVCLKRGHRARECQLRKKCAHCGQENHHRCLCLNSKHISATKTFQIKEMSPGILQTAVALINNGDRSCYGRILLDTGSQRTYITSSLAEKLHLPIKDNNRLLIYTFGSSKPRTIDSPVVNIKITTQRGQTYLIQANVIPHITNKVASPKDYIAMNPDGTKYDMADDGSLGERIDLLIGNDYYHMFMTNEIQEHSQGLYLVNSSFGWIYSGRVEKEENIQDLTVVTYCDCSIEKYFTKPDLPLNESPSNLKLLWEIEAIGIKDSPKTTQQEEVIKHFNETVKYEHHRYQVKWPYITYPPDLPINFGLALGRLKSVVNRMDKESLKAYNQIFQQQLNDGIIEVVKDKKVTGPVHYLPHHGVKQDSKKLRIVVDGSAKTKDNNSLNECLYKGPLMLEDLTALLIRFRKYHIGITADVEKAFLQIGLQPEDRDVTRLLWLKDIDGGITEQNLLHLRFCRLPFGIISSPFLLTATIHHHLNKYNPKLGLVEKIAKQCYVDNLVSGTNSEDEAIKLYKDAKKAFEDISMNIRDWNSNHKKLLNEIPEKFKQTNAGQTNVLGMVWDTKKDTLSLKKKSKLKQNTEITKRHVLRILASVYDPCGFLTPALLPCKVFLQELWKAKEDWDTILDAEKRKQWENLENSLTDLHEYKFPRYLGHGESKNIEIHCFTDAAKYAYAAVLYLRAYDSDQITVSLVMSKSRLTPLKDMENLHIPRLELLGYLIGARLIAYVTKALNLKITRHILWTDSTTVLNWMNTNKLLPPFITRRVTEIKENKEIEFRYVNTQENPADAATRMEGMKKLVLWQRGPDFLRKDEKFWPTNTHHQDQPKSIQVLAVGEGLIEPENTRNKEELESQLEKGRNDNETIKQKNERQGNQRVTTNETESRREEVIREIQAKYYPKEMAGDMTSLKRNLNLFLDDKGILRCKGRMGKSTWTYDMKYPILLPGNCEFTQKVIQDEHVKNYHVGTTHTLSLLRQRYWIPKGRSQVKRVLKKCPQCIKHGGGPYKLPEMPPLPEERITYSKAFDFTGLDYFGPIFITCEEKIVKRWVCLFTCLAVRAIHMEIVRDLSAEECLLAIRRFIASRGVPVLITSDNASQFKISAEVLTGNFCIEQGIKWRFIPELAPWHGGFYERLIGLVKNCLKRTLEKQTLNDNQFYTIIKEVEAVLNTRPLTYVSTDPEHILKPSDFLNLGKCIMIEPSEEELFTERLTKSNLIESWKRGMSIVEEFKKMFVNQYLLSLRERYDKNKEGRIRVNRIPEVGDRVQIKEDASNRLCWKVGNIEEVMKGGDGQIRVAKIRVGNKSYRRSVAHLYPLEIEPDETKQGQDEIKEIRNNEDKNETEGDNENIKDISEVTIEEPIVSKGNGNEEKTGNEVEVRKTYRRNAAGKAREKIAQWTKQLLINSNNEN